MAPRKTGQGPADGHGDQGDALDVDAAEPGRQRIVSNGSNLIAYDGPAHQETHNRGAQQREENPRMGPGLGHQRGHHRVIRDGMGDGVSGEGVVPWTVGQIVHEIKRDEVQHHGDEDLAHLIPYAKEARNEPPEGAGQDPAEKADGDEQAPGQTGTLQAEGDGRHADGPDVDLAVHPDVEVTAPHPEGHGQRAQQERTKLVEGLREAPPRAQAGLEDGQKSYPNVAPESQNKHGGHAQGERPRECIGHQGGEILLSALLPPVFLGDGDHGCASSRSPAMRAPT